jgi:hypothetical protein
MKNLKYYIFKYYFFFLFKNLRRVFFVQEPKKSFFCTSIHDGSNCTGMRYYIADAVVVADVVVVVGMD